MKEKILLVLFGILWVCKPIPYENVVRNEIEINTFDKKFWFFEQSVKT